MCEEPQVLNQTGVAAHSLNNISLLHRLWDVYEKKALLLSSGESLND